MTDPACARQGESDWFGTSLAKTRWQRASRVAGVQTLSEQFLCQGVLERRVGDGRVSVFSFLALNCCNITTYVRQD